MNGTPNNTKPQRTAKTVAATVAVGVRLKGSRMAASGSLFLSVNALTSASAELTVKDQATRSDDGDVSPFHLVGERKSPITGAVMRKLLVLVYGVLRSRQRVWQIESRRRYIRNDSRHSYVSFMAALLRLGIGEGLLLYHARSTGAFPKFSFMRRQSRDI